MKNCRILVTGGAGFIGSTLTKALLPHNDVVVIDDLSSGKIENISSLIQQNSVKFIHGNILDMLTLEKAMDNIQYVFHFAAIPSVPASFEQPLSVNNVNITGTLNVLMAARRCGVKKLVFASSSAIYGDTGDVPKSEDMVPRPQSPYAVSKLTGEYYCQIFAQVFSLPTICLRYFNVYGPSQNPNTQYASVIPKLISMVLENEPPVIFGDGNQSRDFVYVKDAVRAAIVACVSDKTGVFNIGSAKRTTINTLASLIMSLIGKQMPCNYQPAREGDIRDSVADISRAELLGYKPEFDISSGLQATISHFPCATHHS